MSICYEHLTSVLLMSSWISVPVVFFMDMSRLSGPQIKNAPEHSNCIPGRDSIQTFPAVPPALRPGPAANCPALPAPLSMYVTCTTDIPTISRVLAASIYQLQSVPLAQSCPAALSVGDAPFLSHFSGKSLLHSCCDMRSRLDDCKYIL